MILSILLSLVHGCPFQTYEEGLINNVHPQYQETKTLTISDQGDSIGFGFWSQCIAVWTVKQYIQVGLPFDKMQDVQGQFMFVLQKDGANIILYYAVLDPNVPSVTHYIQIYDGSQVIQVAKSFPPLYYEGMWIFTYFTIQSSQIIIEMTDQDSVIIPITLTQEHQLIIGGAGQVDIYNQRYNLNFYRGRLSKLISESSFIYTNDHFATLSIQCAIPSKYNGEQTINIFPTLTILDGLNLLNQIIIDQQGSRYALSGWVKCDFFSAIQNLQLKLLRLTVFQEKTEYKYEGDVQLLISYTITNGLYNFGVTAWVYNIPLVMQIMGDDNIFSFQQKNIGNWQYSDLLLGRFFQNWHFFKYEYGRTQDSRSLFTVIFYDEQTAYEVIFQFGKPDFTGQFINTIYYLEIGKGQGVSDYIFKGQISDFKFQFNYKENLDFQIRCHISCQTCNGPLINNCLSCSSENKRIYLQDLGLCQCELNYLSVEGVQKCQYFSDAFPAIRYIEQKLIYSQVCQRGFFYTPIPGNKYLCLSCPQQQSNYLSCVDCLFYQQTWYEKPICKQDIVRNTNTIDSSFGLIQNDPKDYDIFIIDENYNIQILPGAQDICDINKEQQNCHKTNITHLGQEISIICKENYYFNSNSCLLPDKQCILTDQNGFCIQCNDSFYLFQNKCYNCPLICNSCEYIQNKINCLGCPQEYALQDGECQRCGMNCKICLDFLDEILNQRYLRCYRCIDDNRYALSLDAVTCVENNVKNCKIAFQVLQDDVTINSLDYYFLPQIGKNTKIMCALCNTVTPYYFFPQQQCLSAHIVSCLMGVSLIENPDFQDMICLSSDPLAAPGLQFITMCSYYIKHCSTCINGKQSGFIQCLICQEGYYASRVGGTCVKCPQELNCYQCYQQNKLIFDYWKIDTQAFYTYYINSNYKHSFSLNGLSQNQSDYEILCSNCQSEYILHENKCIPKCPDKCLECQIINGKSVCVKCFQDQFGRQLTVYQNECIVCPSFCALCKVRTSDEIKSVNPLFLNQEFISSTYQCLQPHYAELFYDPQLGQYIQCENISNCQKQYTIKMNLYCSIIEYQRDYNLQVTDYDKTLFKQQNIYIDDLFTIDKSNFPEFEQKNFYFIANQQSIKVIDIQIASTKQQSCIVSGMKSITQQFSKNIFSAIQVDITFMGQNTIIQFDKSITFSNFNHIYLQGLTFQPLMSSKSKELIFQSYFIQQISFIQCNFIQTYVQIDSIQLLFNDLQTLKFSNISFQNLTLSNMEQFILINGEDQLNLITFENVSFSDIVIEQCVFIKIRSINQFSFLMTGITIKDSLFSSSQFISYNSGDTVNSYDTKLIIQSFHISSTLIKVQGFFYIVKFKEVTVSDFLLKNCDIKQSSIFLTGKQFTFKTMNVSSCSISQNSQIILNNNLQTDYTFNLEDVIFADNQYDETSKFINFQKYYSSNSTLEIKQLILSKNNIISLSDVNILNQLHISLVYFSFNYINLQGVTIIRGAGITELIIYNSTNLSISQLLITQSQETQFRALHKYVDCILQYLPQPFYPISILLHSIYQTEIQNSNINQVYNYNTPLIYFNFPEVQSDQLRRKILLKHAIFSSNIQLIVEQRRRVSLVLVESNQILDINFENVTYFGNILHEYIQSQLIASATLININCIQCSIYLNHLTIDSNVVINSTDSIIYINSQTVVINNSYFQNNSQLKYEIIKTFISFSWDIDQTIILDQLAEIFSIQSLSGNGVFQDTYFTLDNSFIFNSFGSLGGAFRIQPQGQSVIECKNTIFENISNYFSKGLEKGGVFYLDASFMTSGVVKFTNLSISNVFCRSQGGMLNIENIQGSIDLQLKQLNLNNVFSKIGSIIYCSFQSTYQQSQYLTIEELRFSSTFEQYAYFLSLFYNVQKQEVSQILNERCLIYIEYGTSILLKNLVLENIFYEAIIQVKSIQKLSLDQIYVYNSLFSIFLINIGPRANYVFALKINELYIQKASQRLINDSFQRCFHQNTTWHPLNFQCQNSNNGLLPHEVTYSPKISSEIDCFNNLENYISDTTNKNAGVVLITDLDQVEFIQITNIKLKEINCNNCNMGLIYLDFYETSKFVNYAFLTNLLISENYCGSKGCINIIKQQQRLLSLESLLFEQSYDIFITEYICINNTAEEGTCLSIQSFSTLIKKCVFCNNTAHASGGSLQLLKTDSKVDIISSSITQNNANIGGGIYSDFFVKNFTQFGTSIHDNLVNYFGPDIESQTTSMKISINQSLGYFDSYIINQTDNLLIEGQINRTFILNLPSGSQISQYYYYDWKSQQYKYPNLQFRIIVLDQSNNIQHNLINEYCLINSRSLSENESSIFTNNYTNIKKIFFDNTTQTFNLDNLTLHFDSDQQLLQLQFQCSPIKIPIFNKSMPYNLIETHNNYYMRVNIHTLPCQYGEIKNSTDLSCYICNGDQYSLIINSYKCSIKDDITMISVKSAMIQLRQQYWRPYFDTTSITYCLNLVDNCLGGWEIGDKSCIIGHIGALCEQCDIYNIRGDGNYAYSQKYQCGLCSKQQTNLLIMIITIIWTLLSLALSVRSQRIIIEKNVKISSSKKLGLQSSENLGQQGVLIKILTNYLQIISSLSTFQLHFPAELINTLNIFGNPIQAISYSQDCILSLATSISIHYVRLIWQLILPFLFLIVFYFIYGAGVGGGLVQWNLSVITTSIVYLYLYFQPNLIIQLVQLVSYRTISGYQWIQNNVAARFDTTLHYEWVLKFCLPVLILLAALIPLFIFWRLYCNRNSLDKKITQLTWGYLYFEYRYSTYYWEVVKIFQKDLIIIALMFFEDDVVIKGSLLILIMQIYSELSTVFRPYNINRLNRLDVQTTTSNLISFILGISIYITYQHKINQIYSICYAILVICNIIIILILLFHIFDMYCSEFEKPLDTIRDYFNKLIPNQHKSPFIIKILQNRNEKRQKVHKNYKKIKNSIRPIARAIILQKKKAATSISIKNTNKQQMIYDQQIYHRQTKLALENRLKNLKFSTFQLPIESNYQSQSGKQ